MTVQRAFTGFNAVADQIAPEQKKAPIVTETFMVHVQSPDCNCRVVAVGDESRGAARLFTHNPCANHWSKKPGPQHELMIKELEQFARQRLLQLIGYVIAAKEPC